MKGIGLSRTIFSNIDLVDIVDYSETKDIQLADDYGFTSVNDNDIIGKGVLVCYYGDLNEILVQFKLKPIYHVITDGVLYRFILSNGVVGMKLTDLIRYEDVAAGNYVNALNSCFDLIHIRKRFEGLADKNLFKNTRLEPEPYYSLKSLFHGGVMNAVSGIRSNVKSYDLISAHASNIVNEIYPTGMFERTYMDIERINNVRKQMPVFYIGNVTFKNIRLKPGYIGIIYLKDNTSLYERGVELDDNGYVISAKELRIAITERYFDCIDICYEYDDIVEQLLYMCDEGSKLPDNIRNYVRLQFTNKNSKQKGTREYAEAKLLVNLCFGFMCRATVDYGHYAYGHKLVYPYQWGVYTCLYTTYKIVKYMQEVVEKGGEVVAIATDSIKYIGDFDLPSVRI